MYRQIENPAHIGHTTAMYCRVQDAVGNIYMSKVPSFNSMILLLQIIPVLLAPEMERAVVSDVRNLVCQSHPNIVKCYEVRYDAMDHNITIVMEYMEFGSIEDIMRQAGTIPEHVLGVFARHVCVLCDISYS
jgi:serine/threonine protein kinase